jgi:hypothetical protein
VLRTEESEPAPDVPPDGLAALAAAAELHSNIVET